ncbi:MAG: sigma-70 family RNA polymerase sigma factor [Bacteroidota bacterium]
MEDNKRIIFKICNSYCSNKTDREDLARKSFINYGNRATVLIQAINFRPGCTGVALNVAISFYRKRKTNTHEVALNERVTDLEDKDDGSAIREENINLLQKVINELKELDRALMILYLEEKTYKEIADILGISETNVATKVGRIKEKIKQRFSQLQKY